VLKLASLAAGLMAAAALIVAPSASADSAWPTKQNIRIIVPFPPGGSVDPMARVLSQKLGEALNQSVIVDNRPGGNAVIGTELTARAAPDGYTLLLTATSHVTNPLLVPTTYDAIKDFVPVAMLSEAPVILTVNPAVPANNLKEFIALAKSEPGKLNFSSAGSGNPNHLAGELFNRMAGVKTTHVPYKGGAPAVADLLGGHVDFTYGSPIIVLPHIKSGKLRALAVSGPTRLASLPDVPTFAEAGLPGYEIRIWYGLLAPAGTPKEVVARLNKEINRILALPEVNEQIEAAGMQRFVLEPDQFEALMKQDADKYGRIIKEANVKLD
jgi:tripartite-type tricarboxylate transporter receptor subunit TctC